MKGFTLLEMLVVVLIAGILASVAMPQYQKAVERSRSAEAIMTAKAIVAAQNRSLDAFPNDDVNTKDALDISLTDGTWDSTNTTYTTPAFTYTLSNDGVVATRRAGNYIYTLTFYNNNVDSANTCSGSSFCANMTEMGFVQAE